MSIKVHNKLEKIGVDLKKTTHKERIKLDESIEEKTDKWCDDGVDDLTDEELLELSEKFFKKDAISKKKRMVLIC